MPKYCKGTPCNVHTLHYFVIHVGGDENEESYVVACSMDHAKQAAEIEGGEGTVVVSEGESADDDRLAACPFCDEDEDADE